MDKLNKRTMKLVALALAGFVFGTILPTASGQKNPDSLRYKTEKGRIRSVKVIILEYGYLNLKYKMAGRSEKELSLKNVLAVKLGGFPDAYKQGMAAEKKAQADQTSLLSELEKAANSYALAAADEKLRNTIKAEALYQSAICTMKLAMAQDSWVDKAVERFREFLTAFPNHNYSLQAILNLGQILHLKGDIDEAVTELKKLGKKVLDENIPVIWEVKSKLEQVRALLSAGKVQDARTTLANANTLLAEITGKKKVIKTLQSQTDLLKGRCTIVEKAYDAAISYFENIISSAGTDLTRKVVGLLGKGEACFFKGKEKAQLAALRKAQLAFSRASVLNPNIKEFSAKAAFYTGEVLSVLASKGEIGQEGPQAADYYREVVKLYPLSAWAAKSRERLEK